jgi:opacity protein-like surface antigen
VKFNSLMKFRMFETNLSPYVMPGLGYFFKSQNSKSFDNKTQLPAYFKGSFAATIGVGCYLTKNLTAELRYEHLFAVDFVNKDKLNVVLNNQSNSQSASGSNSVGLSIAYHFTLVK